MNIPELKKLAEAATPWHAGTYREFHAAANPAAIIALLDRIKELEDGLNAFLVGCEYRSIGGDKPAWHTKQMPSTAALDMARTLLEKSK